MLRRKVSYRVVAIVASALAVLLLLGCVVTMEAQKEAFKYVFYNDTSPSSAPNQNSGDVLDASFSTSLLSAAPEEVRNNPTQHKEWFKEDLYNRLYNQTDGTGDPALLAQLLLDAMLRAPKTVTEKLLPYEEQSTEMWTETILRFVDNEGDHITSAAQLQAILNRAQSYEVRQINGGYTSSGYMRRDGITLNSTYAEKLGRTAVPLPILENNQGVGGYEIVFHFSNGEILSYRINCGYQPDTSTYPSGGKTPGYKPPNIDIDISDPDPSKPTPPPGGEDPDPPPKPDPKNPDGGPQGQNPDNPDYGGGPNTDNDTTPTSEPSSPSTYTPPDPPVAPPPSSSNPPPSSSGGNTETIPVDTDGDGNPDGSHTGEVVTGPQPETPLEDVQKDPPSVEPGLDDGQNSGSIGPPQ